MNIHMRVTAADRAFSDFIRVRDKFTCQLCYRVLGERSFHLHASHFFKRGIWAVRFDEENAMAACSECHRMLEDNPTFHDIHFLARLGQERFDALDRRAHRIAKRSEFDLAAIAAEFRRKAAALGFYRGRGPALSTFVPGPIA